MASQIISLLIFHTYLNQQNRWDIVLNLNCILPNQEDIKEKRINFKFMFKKTQIGGNNHQ